MTAMVPQNWDEISQRTTEQILYHLGRWIYLIDAWDDLEDDLKERQYNPIAARFSLREVPEQDRPAAKEQMERTICHSENLAISAFHLGEFGYYAPVLENILCAGLQSKTACVFRRMENTAQTKETGVKPKMNDPYSVLGITPQATDDEVKQAYRALARKYHPDNYQDNPSPIWLRRK